MPDESHATHAHRKVTPVRDRVVHHAIHRVLAPWLDRSLVDHTYACLPGRGAHRAVLAFVGALRRYRYVVQLDIRRYFLSIHRPTLLALLARKVRDHRLLALFERILAGGTDLYRDPVIARTLGLELGFPPEGCGLPIGNLTSQWWANHYLSGLDHFVRRALHLPHTQRYMDDITLFSNHRGELAAARDACVGWLRAERQLALKDPQAQVRRTSGTFRYLGRRIRRGNIRLEGLRLARAEERLMRLARSDAEAYERSWAAYQGWLRFY